MPHNLNKDMYKLVSAAKHGKYPLVTEILNRYYNLSNGKRSHSNGEIYDLSSIHIPSFIYDAVYGALHAAIISKNASKIDIINELLTLKGINVYAQYDHTCAYQLANEVAARRTHRDPAGLEMTMMTLIKSAASEFLVASTSSSLSQSSNSTYNVMSALSSSGLTDPTSIQSPTLTIARAATSSSIISNNASTANVGEKAKNTNYIKRLEDANYNGSLPDWMEDVITYDVMEDPITIQGQTYDRGTLERYYLKHLGLDPMLEHPLDTLVTYPANAQTPTKLKDVKIRGPRGEENLTLLDILLAKTTVVVNDCIAAFVAKQEKKAINAAEAQVSAAGKPLAPGAGREFDEGEERLRILEVLITSAEERLAELDGRIARHESSNSDVIGKGKEADVEDDDSFSDDDSIVSAAPIIPPPPSMPQDAVTQELSRQILFLAATLISKQVSIASQIQQESNPTQDTVQAEVDLRASQQQDISPPTYFLPRLPGYRP